MSDLFDYDDKATWYEVEEEERWPNLFPAPVRKAMDNEEFLRWEHELSQPNYYDYFLEEMTRCYGI